MRTERIVTRRANRRGAAPPASFQERREGRGFPARRRAGGPLLGWLLVALLAMGVVPAPAEAEPERSTVTLELLASADDVVEVADTALVIGDGALEVGRANGTLSTDIGFRFEAVPIPAGAVVEEAHIAVTSYTYGLEPDVATAIRGLKTPDVAAFSSENRPSGIGKTSGSVAWLLGTWTPNTVYDSPDLTAIVQEVVDQSGWQQGNAMGLVWEDVATPAWKARFIYSRDFWEGPERGAKLVVTYSFDPVPPPPDTTPPVVDIVSPHWYEDVSGVVPVTVQASDDRGSVSVGLFVDGVLIATDAEAPYTFLWDTTLYSTDDHMLRAVATDAAGNTASDYVRVDVDRDNEPPIISDLRIVAVGAHSAQFVWTTDEPATSQVMYRSEQEEGASPLQEELVTSHSVLLEGLQASTTYLCTVRSVDAAGNASASYRYLTTAEDSAPLSERPVASFAFDDTYANVYTNAFPILEGHGFRATEFVCTEWVNDPHKLTLSQLRTLWDVGWEIGSHSADHDVGVGTDPAAYEASVKQASDWLSARGFTPGGFASPGGAWSHDIVRVVRKYHPYLRVADNQNAAHPYDAYKLSTRWVNAGTTIEEVRAWLDEAEAERECVVFSMHGVSNAGFDTRPELLERICLELESRSIPVLTVAEVIRADRPPSTTIDCWVDATQDPVLPTIESPAPFDPSAWNEYWGEWFGYPAVQGMSGVTLPTICFSRSVPNGIYDVYANLYSSGERRFRYHYSFGNPGDPEERHVDVDRFEGDREYFLGTVTVTDGRFSLYTRRVDALDGSDWYGAWGWIKLVP